LGARALGAGELTPEIPAKLVGRKRGLSVIVAAPRWNYLSLEMSRPLEEHVGRPVTIEGRVAPGSELAGKAEMLAAQAHSKALLNPVHPSGAGSRYPERMRHSSHGAVRKLRRAQSGRAAIARHD
jgi:hypothetical protein